MTAKAGVEPQPRIVLSDKSCQPPHRGRHCWTLRQVTTTDQATAEVGTEPLKTLGDFRSGRVLGWNARDSYKRELMFGWNLVQACGL